MGAPLHANAEVDLGRHQKLVPLHELLGSLHLPVELHRLHERSMSKNRGIVRRHPTILELITWPLCTDLSNSNSQLFILTLQNF